MDKKKTIVQAVHAFPPAIGGIETHVKMLSLSMAAQGHRVIVHTAHARGEKEHDSDMAKKGVVVKRHFSIKVPGFSMVVWIPFLPIHLMLEPADAYFSHGYGAIVPFCASIAALLKRKPFYWTVHGIPKFRGVKQGLVYIYSVVFGFAPMMLCERIICVSNSVKEELPAFADKRRAVVIPNGISDIFLSHKHEHAHDAFTVLYVGRLDPSKGVNMLIDAFEKFAMKHKAAKLMLVGPDEGMKDDIIAKAKSMGINVQFASAPLELMPAIYAKASVTVLPSTYEGFGMSVFESWASGVPAIATRVGAAPDFYPKAFGSVGDKFFFDDADGLCKKLEGIAMMHEDEKKHLVAQAKKELANYSWDEVCKKTIDLLPKRKVMPWDAKNE